MSAALELRGAGTALVTPFDASGGVDLGRFAALVHRQVEAGVALLVPSGTTGEAATLSTEEQRELVRTCVRVADGRALVVAGTGSNSTPEAVATARAAAEWGADAVLSLAPPYNKPPQDALVEHFRAVAAGAGVPVVIYNVPSRTGCNLESDTTLRLANVDGVAAIKEASGDLAQCMRILRERPAGFELLSGEDGLTLPLMALGAGGCISVIGNECPAELVAMVEALRADDLPRARALHERLLPLVEANFLEANPIPVKAALASMGLIDNRLRRPLRALRPELEPELLGALAQASGPSGASDSPRARTARAEALA